MKHIIMPKTGLTAETGKIAKWYRGEGDSFVKGEILLDVETDKAVVQVEARFNGKISRILVQEGERAAVSAPLAEAEEG